MLAHFSWFSNFWGEKGSKVLNNTFALLKRFFNTGLGLKKVHILPIHTLILDWDWKSIQLKIWFWIWIHKVSCWYFNPGPRSRKFLSDTLILDQVQRKKYQYFDPRTGSKKYPTHILIPAWDRKSIKPIFLPLSGINSLTLGDCPPSLPRCMNCEHQLWEEYSRAGKALYLHYWMFDGWVAVLEKGLISRGLGLLLPRGPEGP